MADSNPFSALTENNNEEIDQNYEEIDANFDDSENFEFKSLVPDAKVEIPNGDLETKIVESGPSLLACSSTFGYLVAGNSEGFLLVQTQKLRDIFYKAEKGSRTPLNDAIQVNVEGKVLVVSLSLDQLQLLVGVSSGKVLVYNVHDVVTKKADVKPVQTIQLDDELTFIRSDSQGHPNIIAVGTKNNNCKVIKYMTNQVLCTIPNVTEVSFSPLGHQLACGSRSGVILVYDIEGNKVNEIQPPAAMKAGHGEEITDRYVNGILWIEENVYLAVYSRPSKDDYKHTPYIINTEQQNPDDCYIYLEEITVIMDEEAVPLSHFSFRLVRNFGSNIKTLVIIANTGCPSVSVVAQNSSNNAWSTVYLENAPTTPLTPNFLDTYPVGIDVDFSASEPLPPFDASDNDTPVSPFPVLYVSSSDGALASYHVYDKVMARNGEKFSGMVDAKDVNTIPLPQPVESAPPANANKAGFKGPTEIPSFSTLPRPEQPEVKEEPTNTPPTEVPPRFGAFGQPLGFSTPSQTTPFASLQRSLSDKAKVPAVGYGSNAFGTNDSTITFGTPSFSSATTNTGGSGVPAFGGFKNVKMDNGNLFGAKSFVSDTTPSTGPSFTFAPSTLDSKDEPEKKESRQSAFSIPDKKEEEPRPSAFSVPEKKEEQPRQSAFSVPEKKEEQPRPSAFSIPVEKKEEQPTTAKTEESQQYEFSIPEKKEEQPVPEKKEEQRHSAFSIPEKKDDSEKNDETPFSAFEPSDTQSIKKKSSDDFSFEDLKRTIDDSDSGSEITKISSIHDDDEEEQPQESDVSSESSGVHITEDQLHDEEEEDQLAEETTKEEDQKKKDEEEAAQKQNEEERKKKEEEEAERKKKEEEEAAIRKKKEEEEEAARKKKEEEERERQEAERRERERIEAEKREAERIERERLEAEQRERERIEAEKREAERIERERLEAIENTRFAHAETRDINVVPFKRSTGLHPMAEKFEEIYFETSEDLELNHNMLQNIRDNLDVQSKTTTKLLNDTALKNQEQVWKISDSEDISVMLNTLIDKSKADRDTQINTKEKLDDLFNADERLLSKTDDITAYVEEKNFKEPFGGVDMNEEYQIQYDQVQDKLKDVEATLKTVEDKLDDSKKPTKEFKRDNLSTYALRRAKRDIDQSIKKQQSILMRMEEQELKLSVNDSKSDKYLSRVSKRNAFLTTLFNGVTPKNVNA